MTEREKTKELLDYGLNRIEKNLVRCKALVMNTETQRRLLELGLVYDCFRYETDDNLGRGIVRFVPESHAFPEWMYKVVDFPEEFSVDVFGDGMAILCKTESVPMEDGDGGQDYRSSTIRTFGIDG